jgi:hypothetical protein
MQSVLEGRQDMYVKAIAAAKVSGDASKTRRLERQLKVNNSSVNRIVFIFLHLDYSRTTSISSWRCSC